MKFKIDLTQAEIKTTFDFNASEFGIAQTLFANLSAMPITDSCTIWAIGEDGTPVRLCDNLELGKALTAARFSPNAGGNSLVVPR